MAKEIVRHFEPHVHYIEPYCGTASTFFAKEPSQHELLNDSYGLLVSFFRVLRDRSDELRFALEATPWSRAEYDLSHLVTGDELEDARRFAVRVWQAHASDLAKKTGWKNRGSRQAAGGMSIRWQKVPAELSAIALRLQDAELECRPAVEVMERFAHSDVLIYADPPYLPTTRTQTTYACEMTEEDHERMLDVLTRHPGQVVLSGYESDLYDRALTDWRKLPITPPKVEKAAKRTEFLWIKPAD